ncbi:MAG: tetratricopeptide repeat protein [Saprospiraceae bacterium]|nr:tetratricopeptide repeat protein [Saprospiraceae bacterium]
MKKQLRSCLTILFVAFLGSYALGQTINIKQRDSMLQVLQKPGLHDTMRIQAYIDIANFYAQQKDSFIIKDYIQKAEAIALQSGDVNNIIRVYDDWTRLGLSEAEVMKVVKKIEKYYPDIPEMKEKTARRFINIALVLEFYERYAEALNMLNDITPYYEKRDAPEDLIASVYYTKEEIFSLLGDHDKAIESAKKSIEYTSYSNDTTTVFYSHFVLGLAYYRGGRYEEAIDVFNQMAANERIREADRRDLPEVIVDCLMKAGKYDKAVKVLEKEVKREDNDKNYYSMMRLGEAYTELRKFDLAQQAFEKSDELLRASKLDSMGLSRFRGHWNLYYSKYAQAQGFHDRAIPLLIDAVEVFDQDSSFHYRADAYWESLKVLIKSLQATGRYKEASNYQNALLRSMQKELDEGASLKGSLTASRQQEEKRIVEKASLEAKNTQQRRFLWGLGIGLAVMAGLGGVIWRQSKALGVEKKKSEALLLNMLPDTIASRMKLGEHSIADYFEEATVIFIDMVGFTQLSSESSPKEVVKLLNHLFSKIDQLTGAYGLEKIKTIGDCYMAVSGIPIPSKNHLETALQFCKAVLDELDGYEHEGRNIHFKIGVETGPAVAGIIGERRFLFDLWGDTVNMASRMESNGVPSAIQVTANVFEKMKDQFDFEQRGVVEIKGKGGVEVFLMRKEG